MRRRTAIGWEVLLQVADCTGKTHYAYSWTLTIHDSVPGKCRTGPCLREIEKKIRQDLLHGLITNNMTVLELVERYVATKTAVRRTTRAGYQTVLRHLRTDAFSSRRIDSVGTLDAKERLIRLRAEEGKSYSTIHTIRGVLRPAFQIAEEDGLVRRNPSNFELSTC